MRIFDAGTPSSTASRATILWLARLFFRFLPHADFEAVVAEFPNALLFGCGCRADRDEHIAPVCGKIEAFIGECCSAMEEA